MSQLAQRLLSSSLRDCARGLSSDAFGSSLLTLSINELIHNSARKASIGSYEAGPCCAASAGVCGAVGGHLSSGQSATPSADAAAVPSTPCRHLLSSAGLSAPLRRSRCEGLRIWHAGAGAFSTSSSGRAFSSSSSGGGSNGNSSTRRLGIGAIAREATAAEPAEDENPAGPSSASPFPISGLGAGGAGRGGGSSRAARREEEFSFVQVGRPIRARPPPPPPSPPSSSPTPQQPATTPSDLAARQQLARPPPAPPTVGASERSPHPSLPRPHAADTHHPANTLTDDESHHGFGEEGGDDDVSGGDSGPLERIPMVPPHQRQQPPLPPAASRALWRGAEELAGAGRLVRLAVGRGGLSRALLAQAGDLLERHELLRVYLLPNCELEIGFVSWVLEDALDCVCLKVKGRTATLYREHGLPRPRASRREAEDEADTHTPGPPRTGIASGVAAKAKAEDRHKAGSQPGVIGGESGDSGSLSGRALAAVKAAADHEEASVADRADGAEEGKGVRVGGADAGRAGTDPAAGSRNDDAQEAEETVAAAAALGAAGLTARFRRAAALRSASPQLRLRLRPPS